MFKKTVVELLAGSCSPVVLGFCSHHPLSLYQHRTGEYEVRMKHLDSGFMAKKSGKRLARHGRLQKGCVSSFINMFDFRLGRSTRRLISDVRPSVLEIYGNGSVGEAHVASSGNTGVMNGTAKTSVKELMEEDMFNEEVRMNLCQVRSSTQTGFEVEPISASFEQVVESKTWDMVISETIGEQISKSECLLKNDMVGVLDMLSAQAAKETDRKLVEAVKQLIEQKLHNIMHSHEEENPGTCCEELMDSVRMFTANYGLFQELLQESKSASTKDDSFLTNNNFAHSSFLVLNPESTHSETDLGSSSISSPSTYMCNEVKNERNMVFGFSLNEMKRKLLHLMVPHNSPTHEGQAQSLRKSMGSGSTDMREKLHTERSSSPGRGGEEDAMLKEKIILVAENSSQNRRHGRFKIYVEAKKHISEMLVDADENSNTMIKQVPKSLAMMLSDPVDSSPSRMSPRKCNGVQLSQNHISENQHSEQDQDGHPSSVDQSMNNRETSSNDGDPSISFGDQNNFCQSTYQEDTVSEGADIEEAGTATIGFYQCSQSTACPKSDSSEDSYSPISREFEDCEHWINKLQQPSPVSVLQPLFMDDAASVKSEPARDVEPKHIDFEEHSDDQGEKTSIIGVSLEDEESPFKYVEAVLLGSGMNWHDFHLKWFSSQPILDSSLFNELKDFFKRASHDQMLLFDSANEALKRICDLHFGWWKANKPLSIPTCVDLVNEIWRQVESQLMQAENSLDQILQMNIAASGKWIHFQQDIQVISFQIQETIFYELIEDSFEDHQPR